MENFKGQELSGVNESEQQSLGETSQESIYITQGDTLLNQGKFELAMAEYEKAGATDKIIRAGDLALEAGLNINDDSDNDIKLLTLAVKAYEKVGAKDKLIEVGNISIREGHLGDAKELYQKAGMEIPKDKLIEAARACVKKGDLYSAISAYKEAGMEIPKDELIEIGDIDLKRNGIVTIEAYEMAGSKDKLVETGISYAQQGFLDAAIIALEKAKLIK